MRDYEQVKLITNHDMNPFNRIKLSRNIDDMACEGREMFSSNSPPSDQDITSHPVKRRKRSKYCDAVDKICDVCGDVAKSMHFGGMACDSCKAFFRRSVQNDSYKTFKCGAQKSCPVIKDNRRICQYCRFQKCLSVGMEVKWVMSEADRMSLWKSKLTKHRQKAGKPHSSISQSEGSSGDTFHFPCKPEQGTVFGTGFSSMFLRPDEQAALDHLVTLQELVFSAMTYPQDCLGDTTSTMANLFFCICQKLRSFFYRLDDFHEIPKDDQPLVLRNGIAMSIYLHGAYNYDVENQSWPAPNISESLKLPNVSTETLKMFTVYPEVFQTLMDFYNEYGNDLKDEIVLVLLCLITLFHDSDCGLKARAYIQNVNNRYICLLRNYLQHKSGIIKGNEQLTRLLNSLFAVKKITSYHRVVDIRHSVSTDQLISKGRLSLRDQMAAVSHLLNQALISDIPKFASALSPDEKVNLHLKRKNLEFSFRRPFELPNPSAEIYLHHPITNTLLGSVIRTDKLLSFAHKNIFGLKPSFQKLRALSISSIDSDDSSIISEAVLKRVGRKKLNGHHGLERYYDEEEDEKDREIIPYNFSRSHSTGRENSFQPKVSSKHWPMDAENLNKIPYTITDVHFNQRLSDYETGAVDLRQKNDHHSSGYKEMPPLSELPSPPYSYQEY